MDSGSMERKMELQDVFMMKTSVLSRLRMQREDAAHTELMTSCHALLSRAKEMTGLMEQVVGNQRMLRSSSYINSLYLPGCLHWHGKLCAGFEQSRRP
jgi:hypothetical protein